MKTDLTVNKLVQRVNSLEPLKRDYIVPANQLSVISEGNKTYLEVQDKHYQLQERAAAQICSLTGMPYNYYEKLTEYPVLRDENLNTLLADIDKLRMVRCLGRNARAVLSNSYRLIDHNTVLQNLMPIIDEVKGLQIVSASLNDDRMYVKLISKTNKQDVTPGDTIAWGACLINSETGVSSVTITPWTLRLVCKNGLTIPCFNTLGTRRIHKGKQIMCMDDYDQLYEHEDADLYTLLKEKLAAAFNIDYQNAVMNKMREATKISIPNPIETCERIAKMYSLSPSTKAQVLMHFLQSSSKSLYDMMNCITRTASDCTTYEEAHKLEQIGYQLLEDGLAAVNSNSRNNNLLLAA